MAFQWLDIPPGAYRNGTALQSAGRWYDQDLVRYANKTVRPMGGWQERLAGQAVSGAARAACAWRDNSGGQWLAIGTHSGLYVQAAGGLVTNITPGGFTSGIADATVYTGYGSGVYGAYTYGSPRPATGVPVPATVWSLDTFGQYLVGCSDADGKIYQWTLNTASVAAVLSNAPTSNQGIFCTTEGFLVALGAGGDPRLVKWSDQRSNNVWTPSTTNQAGSLDLQTSGQLMCGRATRDTHIVLSSTDAWSMTYVGYPLVYGFQRIGQGCGAISKGALAAIDTRAVWMGTDGFWLYDGYVRQLPCDVYDFVFSDINPAQVSKVTALHRPDFGEVWWFYPSAASTENNRYVIWDYKQGIWNFGYSIPRLCGVDKSVFGNPLLVDASGKIYVHENGFSYGGATPYVEGGPVTLGAGDRMMEVQAIVPDDKTLGDVTLTLYGRNYPDDPDVTNGPWPLTSSQVSVMFQARQVRPHFAFVGADDARLGRVRADLVAGDWQ